MYVYGFAPCVAVVYSIGVYALPYSARWLVLQGRLDEAKESLKFIYDFNADVVLASIVEKAETAAENLKKRNEGSGTVCGPFSISIDFPRPTVECARNNPVFH